jgi:hypothetical protein
MATTIADKLKIKENSTLLTINEPPDFKKGLSKLPTGVKITTAGKDYDQVHWFVLNKAQLEKEMSKVMKLVKPGVMVWVYYPKGSSKMQTDLTRDNGWECLMKESDKLTWINLFSFNETWSIFGLRGKTDADRKKEAKPKAPREIFNWVDPVKKTIKLPDDLAAALKKNKKEAGFFETLSFSNRKEYVEWIVTAKREETRTERIKESMVRLGKGWKNPQNR